MSQNFGGRLLVVGLLLCALVGQVAGQDQEYKVQPGDSFYSIARHFKIERQVLQDYNKITDPSKIKVGQVLLIPGTSTHEGVSASADSTYTGTHKVSKGESLSGLARKYDVPLKEFMSANGLDMNSHLKIGQVLKVPQPKKTASASPVPDSAPEGPVQKERPKSMVQKDAITEFSTNAMLELSDYKSSAQVEWPAKGERFASNGKMPGILIKLKPGDEIRAVNSGHVTYTGPHSIFGHVVFIQSPNGYVFMYGGNETSSLTLNQGIKKGDLVGHVGVSPGLKECYAWFSVWKSGRFLDDPAQAPRE